MSNFCCTFAAKIQRAYTQGTVSSSQSERIKGISYRAEVMEVKPEKYCDSQASTGVG